MHYLNRVVKKINRIRKKNWSAPTIMAAFIITCMLIIYSFESLGLMNKEKNLDYRLHTPEKMIKVISSEVRTFKANGEYFNEDECKVCLTSSRTLDESIYNSKVIKFYAEKDKEKHIKEMENLLLEAALQQFKYENEEKYDLQMFNVDDMLFFDV